MAGIVGAAQIAQQGFRDLSKGISQFRDRGVQKEQAAQFKELRGGIAGELGAGDIMRGSSAGDVLKSQENIDRISPNVLLGKMMGIATNTNGLHSPEEMANAKQVIPQIVAMMSALKPKGGGGGGGSGDKKQSGGIKGIFGSAVEFADKQMADGKWSEQKKKAYLNGISLDLTTLKTSGVLGEKVFESIKEDHPELFGGGEVQVQTKPSKPDTNKAKVPEKGLFDSILGAFD